jgi:hypothetical protein
MSAVPEILYDDKTHTYTRKDNGAAVPSLTRTLQDAGLYDICTWGAEKVKHGVAVHEACSKLLKPASSMAASLARTYVRQFERFLRFHQFVPKYSEKILYNDILGYACRVDLIGEFDFTGVLRAKFPAIVEIKVDDEPNAAGLQLAGQKLAAMRNRLAGPDCRCGMLRLGCYGYTYTDLTDPAFENVLADIMTKKQEARP